MISLAILWLTHSMLAFMPQPQGASGVSILCSGWNYQAAGTKWDIIGYAANGGAPIALVNSTESEISPFPFPNEPAFGYLVERRETVYLYKYDMATGKSSDLGISLKRGVTCRVSPDGKRLACSDMIGGRYQIVVYDLATKQREQITSYPTFSFDPSWSPDGKKLVYWIESGKKTTVGNELMAESDHLAIYDFESKTHVLLTNKAGVPDQYPRWSPDGKWIAFSRMGKQSWNIWVVRPDKSEEIQITTGAREDSFPDWSPDSRAILFQSYRSGDGSYLDIYSVDVAAKTVTQVTTTGRIDEQKPVFFVRP
jgi:TolB protein